MSIDTPFTKENLDTFLCKLAREFRKSNGTSMPAEIILIGRAAILINYGFRDMTYDIDAIIHASSSMKDAINKVGDELGLPNGWLNSDFMKTTSYSSKLSQYSVYYKRFGYVLEVRTISREYLIAMKLMSGRQYKNDISDVIGILLEEQERGQVLTLEKIKTAVCNLYGNWDNLPQHSREIITEIMKSGQLDILFKQYRSMETASKEALISFNSAYPGAANIDNINDIIQNLKSRMTKE